MPRNKSLAQKPLTIAEQLNEWRQTAGKPVTPKQVHRLGSGGIISRKPFEYPTNKFRSGALGGGSFAGSTQSPPHPSSVSATRWAQEQGLNQYGYYGTSKRHNDVPTLAAALEEAAIASKMPTPRHEVRAPMQQMVQRAKVTPHNIPARVRMSFDAVDLDKSGYLEANELEIAFKRYGIDLNSKAGIDRVVTACGEDGRLDYDEYAQLIGELEDERRLANQLKAMHHTLTPRVGTEPQIIYGM